jgi:Na+/H+ antiporter NhaD/arsenite permease-like protein
VNAIVSIFSLLTAAAGWHYLFFSRAAQKLERVEGESVNRARVILRRAGGAVMMSLGVLFFAGCQALPPRALAAVWLGVLLLLASLVVLALVDVRLTWKLKDRRDRRR